MGRSRSRYGPAGCCVRVVMFACRLEGPRVVVTKVPQDAADAKLAAAMRTNLPSLSFRTLGRVWLRVRRCRFAGCSSLIVV